MANARFLPSWVYTSASSTPFGAPTGRCRPCPVGSSVRWKLVMDVWLLGPTDRAAQVDAWMAEMRAFLLEDRRLVEAAQRGYASGLTPGAVHRLEQRIIQWQTLYHRMLELDRWQPA